MEVRTPAAEILSPIGRVDRPAPPWLVGEQVSAWVNRLQLDPRQPLVVLVNGEPVLRAAWSRQALPGDHVAALLLPAGGGGNSGKILRTLAMLAIAVAAAYAGPAIAGALPGLSAAIGANVVSTIATTAITMLGGLLVNALMPTAKPKSEPQEAISPTYSLQPSGNMARLGQPIPRLYGRVKLVPDYASQPFQEYRGDDQYVMQLFTLGLGRYRLEQILLDDTVLWRQEQVRSVPLGATSAPPASGLATDGWVATGGGTVGFTTIQGRPAVVITNGTARHRVARSAVAGEAISARGVLEERSGSFNLKVALVLRNSGGTELDRDEAQLGSTVSGRSWWLRDLRIHPDTAWIDLEVSMDNTPTSGTFSGMDIFEGGLDGSFEDVKIQIVEPGGELTLFPANVETSSEAGGQELLGVNQEGYDWTGPFAANAAGTTTDRLGIDITFPMGLFDQTDSGGLEPTTVSWTVQARLIDDDGDPIGSFFTLGTERISRASRRPLRVTNTYLVAPGRYEVRVQRIDNAGDISVADSTIWDGLKAYLPDDRTWDDVTLLAVEIKATNQISGTAARRLGTIQTALLPTWNGSTWSEEQPTRSIAWAAADILRNPVYGGGLPDSRIDLAGLLALDTLWAERGDRFDFVYDTRSSLWDALRLVARAGRAQPVQIGHVISLRRDQPQQLAKAVFTPANIVRGTFKLQYVLQDDESPDDVEVNYVDEETWQPETVRCVLPGSTSEAPEAIDLPGVQSREQAHREGMWEAACNQRRRQFVSWESELSGRLLVRGDLVLLSHDVPQWGWWGRAASWDPETLTLRLDQPIDWAAGATHYMSLRTRDGREWGPVVVERGADDYELVIDEADHDQVATDQGQSADEVIELDPDWEETHAVVGPGQQYLKRLLLLEMRPRGDKCQMLAVNEDEAVHTAEDGVFPEPRVASLLPRRRSGPPLDGLSVVLAPDSPEGAPVLECAWRPSPDAEYYIGQRSSDGESWTTVYEASGAQCSISVPATTMYLRFAAFGTVRGPWSVWRAEETAVEDPPLLIDVPAHVLNFNIKTAALAAGWDGVTPVTVRVRIYPNVRVGSSSTASPALRTGADWPEGSLILIENYGLVAGRGGNGGNGRNGSGAGFAGGAGGDAFLNEGVPVELDNFGTFGGGGGGGGGGAGGVGGAGGGGGGGQGANGGSGGAKGGGNAQNGSGGTPTAAGAGGAGSFTSTGGENPVITPTGSNGTRGGGLGQPGSGAGGGAAGYYATGDAQNTWKIIGTRLGTPSA